MQWLSSNWSISAPQREASKSTPRKDWSSRPPSRPTGRPTGRPAGRPAGEGWAVRGENKYLGILRNQLLGIPQRRFRQLRPAEHPGHFLGSFSRYDAPYGSFGPSPSRLFLDQVMLIRKCRNLRQMRNTQDLGGPGQGLELLAHSIRRPPADAAIDLVKNHRPLPSPCFPATG